MPLGASLGGGRPRPVAPTPQMGFNALRNRGRSGGAMPGAMPGPAGPAMPGPMSAPPAGGPTSGAAPGGPTQDPGGILFYTYGGALDPGNWAQRLTQQAQQGGRR